MWKMKIIHFESSSEMNNSYRWEGILIFAHCSERSIENIVPNPEATIKSQIIKLISKECYLSG